MTCGRRRQVGEHAIDGQVRCAVSGGVYVPGHIGRIDRKAFARCVPSRLLVVMRLDIVAMFMPLDPTHEHG